MRSRPVENETEGARKTKRSRKNTIKEKRTMRSTRKKRRRSHLIKSLQDKLDKEHKVVEQCHNDVTMHKRMARSFRERWQWELGEQP